MKKSYLYEPFPLHEKIVMEYEARLIQTFYRIEFYELHIQTHEKSL